tara:strand:+ start:2407 stop:2799 length:393 start_codon:yes stop_codon:yes gene_type:complete
MINVKLINSDDYIMIRKWWGKHNWEPVHPYLLSNTGYLVSFNDFPIVAGWYIKTNSLTALVEWIVKNPKSKPKLFIKGLSFLCKTIEEQAKKDGYKMLITFLENNKLKKFMERRDYKKGDMGLDTYVKGL